MTYAGKSVLVTGGAGLIGSFLVERLLSAGAMVIVADDFSKGRLSHLGEVVNEVDIREGDLESASFVEEACEGAEIVFHLASRAYGVAYSSTHHFDMLMHNERITNNLVDTLKRRPVERLLVTSSSCVYPDDGPSTVPEIPLFTGEPELVNWGYGWAKRFLEQKALVLAKETGTKLAIVRPFNIFGERYTWAGSASQAIPMQVKKVLDGDDPVVIWGSGTQRRNYLHAEDCAEAMVGLVGNGFEGAVNIGTEDTVTLLELVETICRLAGKSPTLITDISKPEGRRVKSADSTLLQKALPGFRRTITLEAGLERMIGWYYKTFVATSA